MDSLTDSAPTTRRHTARRRLTGAGLLMLALLALFLTPPLINVNRYRHRIAQAMSESLGRPVHLDNVRLHLFPVPGFTLENLVVSENPEFGSEPTIRANTVEVRLRPGSLWRRQVEFSSVRFVEPSLNLVRNPAGRWNLQDLLVHASRVNTAPTAQTRASEAPRFPYIEATGGRINLKLGDEKTPFSLTEADLGVWLLSPQQWRVRLVGKPTRTDSYISDPGTVRLEGSLGRADKMADVPVHLQASWHDVPLGEASKLLTGDDAGWRGTLQIDAALDGPLGAGRLMTQAHLVDLRRADFVPVASLDIDATCSASANAPAVTLQTVMCSVPTGAQPLMLQSPAIDLQRPMSTGGSINANDLPLNWAMGWVRLFSTRVPADAHPAGTMDVDLTRSPAAQWGGALTVSLPQPQAQPSTKPGSVLAAASPAPAGPLTLRWNVVQAGNGLHLQMAPTTVPLGAPGAALTVSGELTAAGYSLRADGSASLQQVQSATRDLPPLTDGLQKAVAPAQPSGDKAVARLDVICTRQWSADQACTSAAAPATSRKQAHRLR